jgi:GT2 family glycosyltransferase
MNNQPLVSVLMSVYNGERYLREAVESILNQTFTGFEFIIVDDGSTDGTATILDSYTDPRIVRVTNETNIGIVGSLNRGLRMIQRMYLARIDQDDVSLPDRLEEQVCLLEQYPDVVIVGSSYDEIDEAGVHLRTIYPPMSDSAIRWQTLFHCSFASSSVMLRMDVLNRHGLYYEKWATYAEDYALWSRLLFYGQGLNVEYPLVKIRVHAQQASQTAAFEQKAAATRIARSNMGRLGVHVSDAEARTLRTWYNYFPRRLNRQEMALCRTVFQLLHIFAQQPNVDPKVVRRIRQHWLYCILAVFSIYQWTDLRSSGFLDSLAWSDIPMMLAYLSRRALRRLKRLVFSYAKY